MYKTLTRILIAVFLIILTSPNDAQGEGITLIFPLGGYTPYTVPIISVIDHSGVAFGKSGKDVDVIAYTGELGRYKKGYDGLGYYNPLEKAFHINGEYKGDNGDGINKQKVLNYRAHAGYDFECTAGEDILAATSGTIIEPTYDDLIYGSTVSNYKTFKIIHKNGYETWYLHTKDIAFSSGEYVTAGTPVAKCWNTGTNGYHLHFEVRHNNGKKIVDPYGWEWHTADSFNKNIQAEARLEPLWKITQPKPKVTNVTLAGSSGSYTATVVGQNFVSGVIVSLWDRYGQFFVKEYPSTYISDTQILASFTITKPPENYILKVENPPGPRSEGKTISSALSSSFNQLAIIGTPAPGGGTFSSFASFYGMNNLGDVVFSAEVDTDGDGLGDEARTVQFSSGQFSKIEVSGITKIGAAKINDDGDIAFGDASISGRTQAIYFLKAGTSTPIKIAEWDEASPISGTTYYDLRGPLAINMNGDVTFSSDVYDPSTRTFSCCYLFLYSNSDGSVIKVVGKGENTPVGGTFDIYVPTNQITDDGDVIFLAGVNNGAATSGIFRFSSQSLAIKKIVAEGDPAPTSIGGNFAYSFFSPISSVSGQKFVFQANILGGTSSQAIFVKDNVQLDSLADVRVIVQDGQSTNTEVDGRFARPDYPSGIEPFSVYGNPPQIRTDGGVVFFSLLQNASIDGLPIQKGIFLWSGKEFKKVAVVGESLPSGGTLGGLSAFTFNDIGQVVFFVPSIN